MRTNFSPIFIDWFRNAVGKEGITSTRLGFTSTLQETLNSIEWYVIIWLSFSIQHINTKKERNSRQQKDNVVKVKKKSIKILWPTEVSFDLTI